MQGLFPVGVAKGQAVGATGGEAQHTLKSNELPSHAHAFPGDEQLAYAPSPYVPSVLAPFNYDAMSKLAGVGNIYETVEFQPRGDAHNNLPPFIALNFIIKT
jgi:microcystin-dependent protein